MEKEIVKIDPVVIYPVCIIETGRQGDCFTCALREECASPRSMCIKPYKGHKYGCPNYGRLPTCPPNMPCMFDQMYDVNEVYAVVTKFDREAYFDIRRAKRPDLPEGQIRNLRNWQPISVKETELAVREFYLENPDKANYVSTNYLECMGVQVQDSLRPVGIDIVFPPGRFVYRVSFVGKIREEALEKFGFLVYDEKNKEKKDVKKLVMKK